MHDSLASNEEDAASDKGYAGYPFHYGFHPYAPPSSSSHHGHHFGGYEYGTTGAMFGTPTLPPFGHPTPGYSYGGHYGSSEYGHGYAGHSFGGAVPSMIFGQIGQGNVNNGFPIGYSAYGK